MDSEMRSSISFICCDLPRLFSHFEIQRMIRGRPAIVNGLGYRSSLRNSWNSLKIFNENVRRPNQTGGNSVRLIWAILHLRWVIRRVVRRVIRGTNFISAVTGNQKRSSQPAPRCEVALEIRTLDTLVPPYESQLVQWRAPNSPLEKLH